MFTSLDGNGDGCVTEAELRAAAEARDIVLTEEQVQAFMALEADGVCVGLEAYLNSVDGSVEGRVICRKLGIMGTATVQNRQSWQLR